jgi:hypothetical protein
MAEAIDEEDADAGECQKYDLVKNFCFWIRIRILLYFNNIVCNFNIYKYDLQQRFSTWGVRVPLGARRIFK